MASVPRPDTGISTTYGKFDRRIGLALSGQCYCGFREYSSKSFAMRSQSSAIFAIMGLGSVCFICSAIVRTSSARKRQNSGLSVWAGII
jgi:hypothetical protein